jgi:hypothetical protein
MLSGDFLAEFKRDSGQIRNTPKESAVSANTLAQAMRPRLRNTDFLFGLEYMLSILAI